MPKSSGISPKTGMLPRNLDALSAKAAKEKVGTAKINARALMDLISLFMAEPVFYRGITRNYKTISKS